MSQRPNHLRLVKSDERAVAPEEKIRWWKKYHPIRFFQFQLAVLSIIFMGTAIYFGYLGQWHTATNMLYATSVLVFLIFVAEYRIGKGDDLDK